MWLIKTCLILIAKLLCSLFFIFSILLLAARVWIEPLRKGKCNCKTSLVGKVALVTGGNSGIGLETARDLAQRGATVVIASRDTVRSEEAVKDIKHTTGNNNIEYRYLDLSKLNEVKKFATYFNNDYERLDILVNNAGCAAIRNCKTEDGINKVIQVNYVAQFLLTNLLLDKLTQSKPSRIVNVSSYLHKHAKLDYNDIAGLKLTGYWECYNNCKLCQVLWTKALAKKLPEDVVVNSLHPGLVKTNIFARMDLTYRKILFFIIDLLFKTPKEGAQTVIHLCVSPNVVTSGDYYIDCKRYRPAKDALNDDLVEKVWQETMNLIEK